MRKNILAHFKTPFKNINNISMFFNWEQLFIGHLMSLQWMRLSIMPQSTMSVWLFQDVPADSNCLPIEDKTLAKASANQSTWMFRLDQSELEDDILGPIDTYSSSYISDLFIYFNHAWNNWFRCTLYTISAHIYSNNNVALALEFNMLHQEQKS